MAGVLFLKWVNQNLKIKSFIGTSKNAVMTKVWGADSDEAGAFVYNPAALSFHDDPSLTLGLVLGKPKPASRQVRAVVSLQCQGWIERGVRRNIAAGV